MTYELIIAIALLCQHVESVSTGSRAKEFVSTKEVQASCQQEVLRCVGEKPSPEKLAGCILAGRTH